MPSSAPELIESTKKRVRDAVILFEHKEGSRLVDIKDIPTLIRSLGVNVSGVQCTMLTDQLATINADSGADNSSLLTSEAIESVVANFMVTQEAALFRDDYHTLIRAFRAFDPEGKGFIEAEQLKVLMCSRGEPFTEDEANKMLVYAADDQGRVFYEDYAQRLCNDGRKI